MAADDGKKRGQGADPQPLIDAEAFWDDQAKQADQDEQVTAPNQPRPQAPPPARRQPVATPPTDEEDDPDLAVVGPGGMFPGQASQGAGRPRPPARPAARPVQPPPPARPNPPGQAPARPAPPAPRPPRSAGQRPAKRRPKPMAMSEPQAEIEIEEATASPVKIALALVAVVAVSAFLGWFLIGRHAGEPEEGDTPIDDPIEQATPTEPQKAPEPAPEAAAAEGPAKDSSLTVSLHVNSEPSGAQVFVDGEHRGVTPANVRGLPTSGQASLKIVLDGHKPWEQKITLDAVDLNREVNAGLIELSECKAGTGFIYVTSSPPGATIELDGKRLPGKTPKVINDVCAVVPHKIKLERAGFRPWRQEVRIKPEDIHNLEAKLEP